jgi:anhydro-N-acetylmuramic acid kinase|uniref:Anhydro-N-acetylmuramic acid kinase n=1 Tax=Mesoaciditoga lauensis TaxID=1495039 RepID=A0A7V3REI1_9BACT
MKQFIEIVQKKSRKIIGMMSGTSADGVDLVFVSIDGCGKEMKCEMKDSESFIYPEKLRKRILEAMKADALVRDVCSLDFELGEFFGDCVNEFIGSRKLKEIDLIASHGQTIYHNPPGHASHSCTLQIGNGDIISLKSGIVTISDFRVKDVAAGGEGAPLVPHADYILYASEFESVALNNLGGISNVTYIPKGGSENDVMAFDTGPANALIDSTTFKYFNLPFDENGALSSKGKINGDLLDALKEKEMAYILKTPPKSTGKEIYNEDYLSNISLDPYDLLRTLVEFTAWSVYESYRIYVIPHGLDRVILTGGGAMNRTLVESLKKYFGKIPVEVANDWRFREAKAFAVLGNELICGNPSNNPKVTGAKRPLLLGKISLP